MGTRIVRTCDVTGEDLINPVKIKFTLDGKVVTIEMNQKTASQFVLDLANRTPPDVLLQVVEDFFGHDWDKTAEDV